MLNMFVSFSLTFSCFPPFLVFRFPPEFGETSGCNTKRYERNQNDYASGDACG